MEDITNKTADGLRITDDDAVPDAGAAASFMPELPPVMAMSSGMTTEEVLADLKKHPLFMTELDDLDNEQIEALQALAYDGTPLENAANFKEQGNECFREKKYADAKELYGKGIEVLVVEERRRARGEPPVKESPNSPPAEAEPQLPGDNLDRPPEVADLAAKEAANGEEESPDPGSPEEVQKQRALLEQIYVNRAACHLELRNHRSCTLDCAGALRLNPANVKALYRSAKALLHLDKIRDADDACARGLALDPQNAALLALAVAIGKRHAVVQSKAAEEAEREQREERRRLLLKAALRARNIKMRSSTTRPPDMEDAYVQLVPDPDDPASAVSFPTLLVYPMEVETDFIKGFSERDCLEQHFGYVFPLPWDREGAYAANTVECFMDTRTGGFVKVGRKVPLLEVLSTQDVEVVDDMVRVYVVPKSKAAGWVKEAKALKEQMYGPGKSHR